MSATSSRRPTTKKTGPDHFENLERFAWLMDRAFTIPGTKVKVGLDAIIGLLPIGGDAFTGLLQAGLVLVAIQKYHVPRSVAGKMAANVLIDTLIGAVPVLGDLFDVSFKANTRNVQLLREHKAREDIVVEATPIAASRLAVAQESKPAGWRLPGKRSLVGMVIGFLILFALMIAGLVALFLWMIVKLSGHPLI